MSVGSGPRSTGPATSVDILCRVVGTGAGSTGLSDIDAAPVGAAITNAGSVGPSSQATRSTPQPSPPAARKSRTRFIKRHPIFLHFALVVIRNTGEHQCRADYTGYAAGSRHLAKPDNCQATENRLVNRGARAGYPYFDRVPSSPKAGVR